MGKTVADVAVIDAILVGEPLDSVAPANLRGKVDTAHYGYGSNLYVHLDWY